MSSFNDLMSRGFISPRVHGVLDYPLAAILIVKGFLFGLLADSLSMRM